jgi:hypothetical protein
MTVPSEQCFGLPAKLKEKEKCFRVTKNFPTILYSRLIQDTAIYVLFYEDENSSSLTNLLLHFYAKLFYV